MGGRGLVARLPVPFRGPLATALALISDPLVKAPQQGRFSGGQRATFQRRRRLAKLVPPRGAFKAAPVVAGLVRFHARRAAAIRVVASTAVARA